MDPDFPVLAMLSRRNADLSLWRGRPHGTIMLTVGPRLMAAAAARTYKCPMDCPPPSGPACAFVSGGLR
jgi:hypothetical protein